MNHTEKNYQSICKDHTIMNKPPQSGLGWGSLLLLFSVVKHLPYTFLSEIYQITLGTKVLNNSLKCSSMQSCKGIKWEEISQFYV